MACRGAFLLSYFGIKSVKVLNSKFGSWNPKSENIQFSLFRTPKECEFIINKKYIAGPIEIRNIVTGESST